MSGKSENVGLSILNEQYEKDYKIHYKIPEEQARILSEIDGSREAYQLVEKEGEEDPEKLQKLLLASKCEHLSGVISLAKKDLNTAARHVIRAMATKKCLQEEILQNGPLTIFDQTIDAQVAQNMFDRSRAQLINIQQQIKEHIMRPLQFSREEAERYADLVIPCLKNPELFSSEVDRLAENMQFLESGQLKCLSQALLGNPSFQSAGIRLASSAFPQGEAFFREKMVRFLMGLPCEEAQEDTPPDTLEQATANETGASASPDCCISTELASYLTNLVVPCIKNPSLLIQTLRDLEKAGKSWEAGLVKHLCEDPSMMGAQKLMEEDPGQELVFRASLIDQFTHSRREAPSNILLAASSPEDMQAIVQRCLLNPDQIPTIIQELRIARRALDAEFLEEQFSDPQFLSMMTGLTSRFSPNSALPFYMEHLRESLTAAYPAGQPWSRYRPGVNRPGAKEGDTQPEL